MKNLKTSFALFAAAFLLTAGSFAQNTETLVTTPQGCSNIETENYFNGYSLVTVDKSFALANSLISIAERFDCNIKGVINEYPVGDSIKQEKLSKTTSKINLGNWLKLAIVSDNFVEISNSTISQNYSESWRINFTSSDFEYIIENSLHSDENSNSYGGSVLVDGVKIYDFKNENGKNEITENDDEKLTLLFDQLTTYLAALGCTVEVVQADALGRDQNEKQEYVCLSADKEKFTANVKFENSKPK